MEETRIKLGIYAELPKILEMVKVGAIEREAGMKSGAISSRLKHTKNGPYSVRRFTESDIPRVNQAVWSLGRKLSTITVEYSSDRNILVPRLKDAFSDLFIKSLATKALGVNKNILSNRMSLSPSYVKYSTFTEDETVRLVFCAREIAMRLLSTEFYLDEG